MIERDWHGLYAESWKDEIVPEAFAHPAKFSRGLIRRIYEHLIEQGWLKPGDIVLDCFAGVGLGGVDAASFFGLHWLGIELEQRFVDLGAGYDCPGFTKEDWKRYHARAGRINYTRGEWFEEYTPSQFIRYVLKGKKLLRYRVGHHWCSDCAAAMASIGESRIIPHREAHRYKGNTDLWLSKYGPGVAVLDELRARGKLPPYGSITLIQGDSRNLAQILSTASGVVSSPPYSKSLHLNEDVEKEYQRMVCKGQYSAIAKASRDGIFHSDANKGYGSTPGQLGNLPPGDLDATIKGVISSPPYAGMGVEKNSSSIDIEKQWQTYRKQGGGMSLEGFKKLQEKHSQGYGSGSDNLANLPEGEFSDAVITSPPFADNLASDDPDKRGGLFKDPKRHNDKTLTAEYGGSPGQMGKMKDEGFDGVIGSPPYAESVNQSGVANDADKRIERKARAGVDVGKSENIGGPNSVLNQPQNYGSSPGQLGAMKEGKFDGVVTSPPYIDTPISDKQRNFSGNDDIETSKKKRNEIGIGSGHEPIHYTNNSQNLGNLPPGSLPASVSSPPYENSMTTEETKDYAGDTNVTTRYQRSYGDNSDNLGNSQSDTFWHAARQIVEQTYQVLKPGAIAVWVLKAFVRKGEYIDFPDQWRQLGEACGFETVELIRAWLVEDRGTQYDLWGQAQEKTIERKSFFRRLAESKGSPRIDFEIVLIQRKPLTHLNTE